MQRRSFFLGAVSGLALAAQADSLFSPALAMPSTLSPAADDRVLVIVNLQGGNDGLNTLVPYTSPAYYRYRPTIAIPASKVLDLDANVGFNPALRSLKELYDRGRVAVVQGVGYPNPDHSHFRSTEIWQTAAPERFERTGWVGRYLDESQGSGDNLFDAVALSDVLPKLMLADRVDVPAIAALRGYGLSSDRSMPERAAFGALTGDARMPFSSPYLVHIAELEAHARRGSQELPQLIAGYTPAANYPATQIGRSLALAAQIAGSRLGTRVIYVQHGSFDTHASQRASQDRLLQQLGDALSAFYADLAAHGNDARTLTMTFSEFGRRVAENASQGTDHGEAAPLFLIGPVRGGLYGHAPSLEQLDNGDATYTTDFRSVYATVIERWLGRPSMPLLGGSFPTIDFV